MTRSAYKLKSVGSGRAGKTRRRLQPAAPSEGISKPAIRRLARRAGVKRMAEGIYTEAPLALRAWLKSIIGDAVVYADHARRFTLTVNDIILSLKKNGATLYGYTYYEKRERLTRKLPASSLVRNTAVGDKAGANTPARAATRASAGKSASASKTAVASAMAAIAVATPGDTPKAVCGGDIAVSKRTQMKMTGGGRNRKAGRLGVVQAANYVTPERAQDIQKSLSTFRDTVIERQNDSSTSPERMQDWVAAHMLGRGVAPCTADEMGIVLEALIEKDAVMRADGKLFFV